MSEQIKAAPSRAKASAIARPLPELEPVTTATLPLKRSIQGTSHWWAFLPNPGTGLAPTSADEVLHEPVPRGPAGRREVLGIGVEVGARQQLQPLGLARPPVGGQGKVRRGQVVT